MSERLKTPARESRRPAPAPPRSPLLGRHPALLQPRLIIQPKLVINPPGDRYEQEADRAAEQVLRMPAFHPSGPAVPEAQAGREDHSRRVGAGGAHDPREGPGPALERLTPLVLQRQSEGRVEPREEDEEQRGEAKAGEVVQAKGAGGTLDVTPETAAGVAAARAGGRPLPAAERAFFEPRFGYDFGAVRIHTDAPAVRSARGLGALAYTAGRDIVFGPGRYAPGTSEGRRLLAHELAHVVQQNPSPGRPAPPAGTLIQRAPEETRTISKVEVIKKKMIARVTLSDGTVFNLPLNMRETRIISGTYRGQHVRHVPGDPERTEAKSREDKILQTDAGVWRFSSDSNSPVPWHQIPDSEYDLHVFNTIEEADAPAKAPTAAGETSKGAGGKGAGDKGKGEGAGEGTKKEEPQGAGGQTGGTGTTGGGQISDEDRKVLQQFHDSLAAGGIKTEPVTDEKLLEVLKGMSASERDDFVRYIKESRGESAAKEVDLGKLLEFYKNLSPSDRELLRANLALRGPGAEGETELPKEVTLNLSQSAQETVDAGAGVETVNEQLKKVSDELTDENLKELAQIHSKIAPPEAFSRGNLDPIDLTKIPIFNEMMMFEGLLAGASTQSPEIEGLAKEIIGSIAKIRSHVMEEIAWLAAEMAAGSIISALLAPVSGGASVVAGAARAAHLLYRLNQLRKFIKKVEEVYTTYSKIRQIIDTVTRVTAAYDKYKVFKARYDELTAKFEALQAQLKTSDDETLVEQLETLEDTLVTELQAQLEAGGGLASLLDYFYIPEEATDEDLRRILYNMPRGFEALNELAGFYTPGRTGDLEYTKTLAFKSLRVGILLYPFVGFLAAEVSNRLSALLQDKTIAERLVGLSPGGGGRRRKLPKRQESHAKLKGVKKKRPEPAEGAAAKKQEPAAKKKPDESPQPAAKKKGGEEEPAAKKKEGEEGAEVKKKDEEEADPKKKAAAEEQRRADDEWAQVMTKVRALPGQHPRGLTQDDLLAAARKISTRHKTVAGGPKVSEVTGEGYWSVKIERKKSTQEVSERVLMSLRTRLQKGRRAVEAAVEARAADKSDKASVESLIAPFKDKYHFQTLRVGNRTDELQGLAVFGSMDNQREIVIVTVDDVSKLHYGTEADPIPINWYKEPGNYPKQLKIRGGSIQRDSTSKTTVTVKDKSSGADKFTVEVGLDQSNFVRVGDKLHRQSTPRSNTKQKEFREALLSVGYDWTDMDADHVKDLGFKGKDDFDNLWPLNYVRNRHAFLGSWYTGYHVEYRDSADQRKSKTGTLYELRGKYFKVVGYKTNPPKGYGGKE